APRANPPAPRRSRRRAPRRLGSARAVAYAGLLATPSPRGFPSGVGEQPRLPCQAGYDGGENCTRQAAPRRASPGPGDCPTAYPPPITSTRNPARFAAASASPTLIPVKSGTSLADCARGSSAGVTKPSSSLSSPESAGSGDFSATTGGAASG